ncbi:apolipoprotein N-acyltransferase [Azovibrio restrictus]|uniref:apolipoprotein N-acyltransferase n=1 Tax=Azovibrio restrictus TaxID=146938 RepID=UPI0026EC5E7D|nr:apolipoprotein N-acyltransferase [Azovibrio restrictus]
MSLPRCPRHWQEGRAALLPAFLAGGGGVLAFAPFGLAWLLPLLLALLFHLLVRASAWGQAAWRGGAFGLGLFLAGVSWVYVSLSVFGGMSMPLAALATLLFCAYLALFPALLGGLLRRFLPAALWRQALLFAALWALADLLRGWLFTGFPWLALGYSQVPPSPLAGYAPLLGVYGLTFLTALAGAWLLWRPWGWLGIAVLLAGGWGLQQIQWTQPRGEPLSVALVQGNVAQDLKWRPERFAATLTLYRDLVSHHPARLTILPETALPAFLDDIPRDYLMELKALAARQQGDLLLGVPTGTGEAYWNSAVSFGASPSQQYSKTHLVPFGEFIPPGFAWFLDLARIPMSSFSPGPVFQPPLALAGQQVAVNICYEDLFGRELLSAVPEATLLVNMSNTAWFGRSLAQPQHLQIARLRALETGRPMLRATNTGMTAVVQPDGRVQAVLAPFTTGVLEAQVQGYTGSTPYVLLGDGAALLLVLLALGAALLPVPRVGKSK